MADDSSDEKSSAMRSVVMRAGVSSGSTRWSGRPNSTPKKGVPRNTRRATTAAPITRGRFMTTVAMVCHMPSPTGLGSVRFQRRSESTR